MKFTIQKAGPADLPAVAGLYGAVCDGLAGRPYNPGWSREGFPTRDNAETYLRQGSLLLARAGDAAAGSIAVTPNPSAEEDGTEGFPDAPPLQEDVWYIHVVAVHPDFQRQGLGSQLLAAVEELARQAGASALRLYVWEHNTPAIRAYEKAGFACLQKDADIGLAEFGLERFWLMEKAVC